MKIVGQLSQVCVLLKPSAYPTMGNSQLEENEVYRISGFQALFNLVNSFHCDKCRIIFQQCQVTQMTAYVWCKQYSSVEVVKNS